MENKKLSSVEWLMEKIATKDSDSFIAMSFYIAFKEEFQQAVAMHKEEIDQSYSDGYEFALINECAEKSTTEASSYSDGYKNGWKDCKTEINKKAIEFINSVKKQDNEQQ